MAKHRFDPISFVFGLLAMSAGVVVLAGGELSDEGRVLLPIGLIAVGVALLIELARRPGSTPAAARAGDGLDIDAGLAGTGAGGSDRDDLFAPVDDVLSTWPPTEPTADVTPAPPADDTLVRPTTDPEDTRVPPVHAEPDDTRIPPTMDPDDTLIPSGPDEPDDTLVAPTTDPDDTLTGPARADDTLVPPGGDDETTGLDEPGEDGTTPGDRRG